MEPCWHQGKCVLMGLPINLFLFIGMAHVPFFIVIVGVAGLLYKGTYIAGIVAMPPVQWQVCQCRLSPRSWHLQAEEQS